MLKSSMPVDLPATSQALRAMVGRVQSQPQLEERSKVAVVLLKLHAL
jgi:hypothetical protein